MENLDIFAKIRSQLTKTGSQFKTKIGGILTIIQVLVSIAIIVFFANREFENKISSYSNQRNSISYRNTSYAFLMKYPKYYTPHLRWVNEFPLEVSTSIKECSDEQYAVFYNTTPKDSSMDYMCNFREHLHFHIYDMFQVGLCSQFMKISLYDAIIDTLNCSLTEEEDIDISNFNGEYWIRTTYYNETSLADSVEYKKESYSFSNNDREIGNIFFEVLDLNVNTNPFIDEIKSYAWTNHELRFPDNTSDFLFCIVFYLESCLVKTIVSPKINEKLVTILTILSILNLIFNLISNFLTRYYFELYVLENCFSNDELLDISKDLSFNDNNSNTFEKRAFIKKLKSSVYSISNLLFSTKSYLIVNLAIKNKLAIEKLLKINYSASKNLDALNYDNSFLIKISKFLKKIDFFSENFKLNINKDNKIRSKLGAFLSILTLVASILIVYYFGYNFFNRQYPNVSFYEVSIGLYDQEKPDFKSNTMIMLSVTEQFSRMTVPVLSQANIDYPYKSINYRDCTKEEVEEYNIDFPQNINLSHICFNFDDLVGEFYEENTYKAIHFVNCTKLDYLGELKSKCEKDLITLGDPIYARIDLWSYSIDPFQKEYKSKIHLNLTIPNLRYDYNKHYFTPKDMNDPLGFYREYKEYHSYFFLFSGLIEFYNNNNLITENYEQQITSTIMIIIV